MNHTVVKIDRSDEGGTPCQRHCSFGRVAEMGPAQTVSAFRKAHAEQNFSEARALFNQHSLIIWYAIAPDELGPLLDDLIADAPHVKDTAGGFQVFLTSAREQRFFSPKALETLQDTANPAAIMMRFGYLLDLRMMRVVPLKVV